MSDDATCAACDGDGYRLSKGVYRPCSSCDGSGLDAAVLHAHTARPLLTFRLSDEAAR